MLGFYDFTVNDLKQVYERNEHRIIVVTFLKRTTGEMRTLHTTRNWDWLKEHADETGYRVPTNEASYNPDLYGLVRVWDLDDRMFKCIPASNIQAIYTKTYEEYRSR